LWGAGLLFQIIISLIDNLILISSQYVQSGDQSAIPGRQIAYYIMLSDVPAIDDACEELKKGLKLTLFVL